MFFGKVISLLITLRATFQHWKHRLKPGKNSLTVGTLSIAVAVLVFIWLGYVTRVANEKILAIQSAIDESANIAAIVAANFDEVLGRTKLYSQIALTVTDGDNRAVTYLNPMLIGDAAYLRSAVFDASGTLLYSSANRADEPELHRLIAQSAATTPSATMTGMVIGFPPQTDGAAWRLPLIVPLKRSGFYGAVIDLGYFLRLYKNLNLSEGGQIRILRSDGSEIAELSASALAAHPMRTESPYAALMAGSAMDGAIDLHAIAAMPASIGAFRKLTQFPLTVVVVRDAEVMVQGLKPQHEKYLRQSRWLSVLVVFFAIGLLMTWHRQQRLYEAVAHSEKEKLVLIDLLEAEKSHAYQLASHDYLTGIPNRMLFYEMATVELARAQRSRNIYALLFLDLDKFKLINDTLGHAVGDLLLKEVARRLRTTVREYDLVARLGGDEFVVMLSEMPTEEAVATIAAELLAALSAVYHDLNGNAVETTSSIGIALYPRDGQTVNALLSCADTAMYCAKSRGRGRYCFHDASLNASSARKVELSARFRHAIKNGEFCLHYQARVDVNSLQLVGLEALVRWQHPQDGLIFPGDFIALAEEHGYIVELGEWVAEAACRQLTTWCAQGLPLVPVAINVSARQLRDSEFASKLIAIMAQHQISAALLELEVTESCFIDNPVLAHQLLSTLAGHGIKVSLDDYGTGFSGLSSIKTMPIYAIKIDRSFIRDIRNDHHDAVIVASTITLAHNLTLVVVAEGVETKAQLVHLKAAGCDQVQGFYLHRPSPAAAITALLLKPLFTLP